jgi:hypothetical protein
MSLCPSCGSESATGNKFCGSCGAVLPAPEPGPHSSSQPIPEASAWTPGSQSQKPQREREGINAGVVAASAAGVLLILGGIAWFMWPAGSSSGPDPKLLVSRLTSELPAYIKLTGFQVTTVDRGNEATPVIRTRFQARLVARADTFVETRKDGDIVFLAPRLSTGAVQPVTGSALSRLNAGEWQTEFTLEDNAIARFGTPREFYTGTRVLVEGSAEELAYREEQQRGSEEAKALEAQRVEAQLAAEERRREEARLQVERARAAAAEAERERGQSERQLAEAEALRGRQAEDRKAAEAAQLEERKRQAAEAAAMVEIPAGTELDVRLTSRLNSGTASVEDRFEAVTVDAFSLNERAVIPAGSVLRGIVSSVQPATRTNRTSNLTISFDQLTIDSRSYQIRGSVQEIKGRGLKGETGRIAVGSAIGAILGGILGGGKGAIAGVLMGGGGTVAATEGKQVDVPEGSILRVRLDTPVRVR